MLPIHYSPIGPPLGPTQCPTVSWNLPKKVKKGKPDHSNLPEVEQAYFSSGSAASGLLHLPIPYNGHMNTALLDSGASHNFIALAQLK